MHTRAHIRIKPPSLPFDRQHCILVRVATPICKRPYQPCGGKSRATYRDEKKRKEIEREGKRDRMRETEKEGERDEEMGVGARRKGTKEGPKGSPGIMATTLRSGLRAPKSRPVSMPGHRHSFEAYVMHVRCCRIAARSSSPLDRAAFRTPGRNFSGGQAPPPPSPIGPRRVRLRLRNYWLSLVVYLAYC